MYKHFLAGIILTGLFISSAPVSADTLWYDLSSHPDGNESPPPYGLRLDGLYTLDTSDVWGFDFDHASSNMLMTIDTDTDVVHIFGQSYGGLDVGSDYDTDLQGLWDIDFTYSANVSITGSGAPLIDVVVDPEAPLSNNGTLTALFSATDGGISITNGDVIALEQEMEFFFNNIENHRLDGTGLSGPDVSVGWGWLNHSDSSHIDASDWLFTATVVPIPAAAWLFLSGLGTFLAFMRRKTIIA
jgi:hypothetical protein